MSADQDEFEHSKFDEVKDTVGDGLHRTKKELPSGGDILLFVLFIAAAGLLIRFLPG